MDKRAAIVAEIPRIRRCARALLGNAEAADDLVQDCLERGLARIDQWRRGESPRKWLFSLLHNLHVDRLRRAARRPPHAELAEAVSAEADGTPPDGFTVHDIERSLAMLPEEQRQTVLLVGLEGLTYREAAEVLGVPVGTVMSRLSRGRERLRRIMGYEGGRKPPLRRVK